MPLYKFACGCGRKQEVFWPMNRSKELLVCSCSKEMYREYNFHNKNMSYSKPIHSDSLAISPLQRTEHEQLFPDVKLDDDCRPVFDEFQPHDNYLKKTGFRKKRQRIKPKGVRIA